MMTVDELVARARQDGGSDIHLICGLPPKYRVSGGLENMSDEPLTREDCFSVKLEYAPGGELLRAVVDGKELL